MAIANIIDEIDLYLSRLREVRAILLEGGNQPPHIGGTDRKRKVSVNSTKIAGPSKPSATRGRSRSIRSSADLAPRERVGANISLPNASTESSHMEQTAAAEPKRSEPVSVNRVVARHRSRSTRSVRIRLGQSDTNSLKPAIALVRPTSEIVVVSAEQVQRERKKAKQSVAVMKPRPFASVLGGRSAFEALFKDTNSER